MSLFGSMKTAVSGMNAQANRLSTVSDNIANSATTGYKSSSTSFSSLVLPTTAGTYSSGGVATSVQYAISQQGGLSYTSSTTDLAIQGEGFFVVQDAAGTPYLTRAGDFSPDANGNLVNAAGYSLMGYSYGSGSPSVVVNGFDGLVPINTESQGLTAVASTTASFSGNLDSTAAVATGNLPASNTAPVTTDTKKTSLIAYDTQGNKVQYDFYYTKTAADTWDVSVYRGSDAATGGTSSFPYSSAAVGSGTLVFDSSGKITSGGTLAISDPNAVSGTQDIAVDISGFSQLAASFGATGKADGQAPSAVNKVTVGTDGTVTAQYADGTSKPLYRIPLANVASPDNLTVLSGNVYSANGQSGVTVTGFPQSSGLGYIQAGALEESNVDLAGELTTMIQAQKSYTANSKVFQTGSDLMDVLVNLVR
ncbi:MULTISPECIES: flagellar hook protein FlgE [unclassified Rhizobium]|uniref:flagellar hook protein FlgE n=1 Tax=unclassified Rhizobium TaxID=2613769 RepID=UPI001ADA74ED|nr:MULTISPECIES: flagellar hook protein FlgE [unclassified Rhizobium]MBO9097292.1 flagellar hook protein FlgE [Rhizobium sp. L58/93]MBO9133856.1 flagellar hook protein FlgE [Rhizobium sp. B209b/85]MBO9167531.1 flagellar hook protein FlgE [Rhizobium sp. L245/93]MBO9183490.1 flagellar hook protein FlgE [Rhizobium sp. E27B/91]QXZ83821.1 flagellar hook protein FlgE [Rhizobium sp. K1/93]